MNNFENLLKEIREIAKNISSEEFKKDCKEYDKIYTKRNYNLFLEKEEKKEYVLTNQYFSVDVMNTFTDDTYLKVG